MTKITIQPAVYHKGTATCFCVRYINYTGPTAVADCHLWTNEGVEIEGFLVNASAEQCAAWDNDVAFAGVLAVNAGLTPTTDPATEWTPPAPPAPVEPAPEPAP